MNWIIIIFIIIVAFAVLKLIFDKIERKNILSSFQKKERVMNDSEKTLYNYLQRALGNDFVILSKVRVEDFVEVSRDNVSNHKRHWGLRNRIKSRHVDFLICDCSTTKPLLAIELDGKSHRSLNRQERDLNMDEIYKAIGLQIKHISVGSNFENEAENIRNILMKSNLS